MEAGKQGSIYYVQGIAEEVHKGPVGKGRLRDILLRTSKYKKCNMVFIILETRNHSRVWSKGVRDLTRSELNCVSPLPILRIFLKPF